MCIALMILYVFLGSIIGQEVTSNCDKFIMVVEERDRVSSTV